ncbi:MAG: hypothetical protein ACRDD1_22420, partial [Planctomycetia bacterium]
PTFEAVGAVQQTGSWVAAVPPGLDAETEQTVGLAPTAPEQIDWLSQEAAQAPPGSRFLAYRQDRRPASLTLRLRRLEPRLRATGLTVVSLRETSVAYITQLNWTIEQAGVSRLVFSAPDWLGQDLDVQGAGVRQVEPGPAENGRRRFVVALDREILGRYTLHLVQNLPLPADANLRFPRTTAEGVEAFDAFAVLQNLSPDQLDRRDDPALKVEAIGVDQAPAGLSPFVRRTAMEVFRLVGTAGELSWRMRSSEKVEALSASVNLAELVMVVEADRRYRAQANYRVANRNEQFLTLEFPEDCQVWSVFVAGQPARPARSMRDGKQVVLAPLPKTAAGDFSAVVEVVYTGALPAAAFTAPVVGSAVGGLAADWAVPTPRVVGLPVAETQWTLYLPRDFNYGWFRGTLEEVDGGALDLNRAAAVYREAFRLVGEANYGKGTAKGRARDNLMELKQRGIQPSTSATQAAAVRNKEKFIELQQRVQSEASQLSQAIEQLEKQPAAPGAGPVRWDEFFDAPAAQPQQPTNENLFRTPQQQLGKSVADYEEKNVRYRLNRRLESQTANLNWMVKQQSDQLKNAEVEQLREQVAAQEQAGSSFGSILGGSQTRGGDAGKKKAMAGRYDSNQAHWYLQNRFGQLGDNSDKRGSAKDAA